MGLGKKRVGSTSHNWDLPSHFNLWGWGGAREEKGRIYQPQSLPYLHYRDKTAVLCATYHPTSTSQPLTCAPEISVTFAPSLSTPEQNVTHLRTLIISHSCSCAHTGTATSSSFSLSCWHWHCSFMISYGGVGWGGVGWGATITFMFLCTHTHTQAQQPHRLFFCRADSGTPHTGRSQQRTQALSALFHRTLGGFIGVGLLMRCVVLVPHLPGEGC